MSVLLAGRNHGVARDEERLLLVAVLVARPLCRGVVWCGGQKVRVGRPYETLALGEQSLGFDEDASGVLTALAP